MPKKLYFPFVMVVELAILVAFAFFLVDLFPTLDPNGYLYSSDVNKKQGALTFGNLDAPDSDVS